MDIKKLSIAEIRNIAKRINSRLSEFERQGLTDSAYYQRIITAIAVNRFKRTEKGHISLSKESLQLLQANQSQLLRIDSMPSLKHEVKLAKKYGLICTPTLPHGSEAKRSKHTTSADSPVCA